MLPPPSSSRRIVFSSAKNLPVNLYRPKRVKRSDELIVAVHGISRQYQEQLEAYRALAERKGCWLLVPEFSKEAFPGYQRLAKDAFSARADVALNTVLIALKGYLNQPLLKMHLCGFSGGAQFSHRYALLYPQNVVSLVLCSAGWYTFPDENVDYPYGLGKPPRWLGRNKIEQMLALPILVMVGDKDIGREKSLRKSKDLDMQQGSHRLERAERWVEAVTIRKQLQSVGDGVQFFRLSGQEHDFVNCVNSGGLLEQIEYFWDQVEGDKLCAV